MLEKTFGKDLFCNKVMSCKIKTLCVNLFIILLQFKKSVTQHIYKVMSVFLKKNNCSDDEKEIIECDSEKNNPILEYYEEHLCNLKPNALYRNTKFMTIDKINGGLLTEEEQKNITDSPTGYNFNLKNSGYFVVDVDMEGYMTSDIIHDYDKADNYRKQVKLLNPKLVDENKEINIPEKIRVVEFMINRKRKKIDTKNFANVFFSSVFMTPYVLTPSKGFHYYFKNDLTDEQIKEIFGCNRSRYINCMDCFNNLVHIDIFLDNKKDDAFLVLPLSNVIIENKKYNVDQENNYKVINVSYSGVRYSELEKDKLCEMRNASELVKWLKKYVVKKEYEEPKDIDMKYSDRGRVIAVNQMNRKKYINLLINDFRILSDEMKENITTFASKPFNLYQLMAFIAFFPMDMHLELLKGFMDTLSHKLSDNAKEQLLNYYYHLAGDKNKEKDLKHPRYFEAILNKTYYQSIDNKYTFEYENDKKQDENEDEEVVEDETVSESEKQLEEIVKKMAKIYKELKMPAL